jgi:hypothetical protein
MGTMPLEGHWYLLLCPHGMNVAQMIEMSGEHHGHHKGSEAEVINCDFALGSANDDLAFSAPSSHSVLLLINRIEPLYESTRASNLKLNSFHARAPPKVRFFYS